MLIGYARVSTDDQNLNRQRDALQVAGCTQIYEDQISGAQAARPGLEQALSVARTGDVLVVWRLDRLGRSLKDLIAMVETLAERGIELQSLTEARCRRQISSRSPPIPVVANLSFTSLPL